MIRKYYIKKIIICLLVIVSLYLIYLIPDKNTLNIEEEINYVDSTIMFSNIFLLDQNNNLGKTKIITKNTDTKKLALELIDALTLNSTMQDKIPSGFSSIIPDGTKVLNITIDNGIAKVNFNEYLLETNENLEEKVIEAIIYTLTELDEIDSIIIYINGEILSKLPKSNITLPTTLNRNFGINKEYNITSKDNINKTTIYYISKFNNDEYYVPVTKVTNDPRSKIEIIIDELSSSKSYNTNLMSYLDNNTKIVSFEEEADKLTIEFNELIFSDIDTKNILEEVIYTISHSINDNYNVNEIVFNVNGEEIYKSVSKSIE